MKKYNTPIMEVSRFDTENVVTGSGFDGSATKTAAVNQLKSSVKNVDTDILTFTF